jgi:hypothetical protein
VTTIRVHRVSIDVDLDRLGVDQDSNLYAVVKEVKGLAKAVEAQGARVEVRVNARGRGLVLAGYLEQEGLDVYRYQYEKDVPEGAFWRKERLQEAEHALAAIMGRQVGAVEASVVLQALAEVTKHEHTACQGLKLAAEWVTKLRETGGATSER